MTDESVDEDAPFEPLGQRVVQNMVDRGAEGPFLMGRFTVTQVQSHLIAHQYEGLIKKQRLRGRR